MRTTLAVLAFAVLSAALALLPTAGQAQILDKSVWKSTPLYCHPGDYMVGIGGRVGNWVNTVYPICAHFNPSSVSFGQTYPGPSFGDNGGAPQEDHCAPGNIVTHVETRDRADFKESMSPGDILAFARMQYVAFKCTPAIFLLNKDSVNHGITSTVPEDGFADPTQMPRTFSDCPGGTAGTGLDASYYPYKGTPGVAYDPYAGEVVVKCGPMPQAEITSSLPPGAKKNTDYLGSDIAGSGPLSVNDPSVCYNNCRANSNCLAWTYVHPGVQGPSAVCYLKNPVPGASANNCCISGLIPRYKVDIPLVIKNRSIFQRVKP